MEAIKKIPLTLVIDIGGTGLKMLLVDAEGLPANHYICKPTPRPATKKAILYKLINMIQSLDSNFERIAAGFPGVVQQGLVRTATNMDPSWIGVNLQQQLQLATGKPVRVINDADLLGYGAISGKGVELVITLGTGLGSSLFLDGKLLPNLELGQHPFLNNQTYDDILGKKGLENVGADKWNFFLKHAVELWEKTFNQNKLFLGGGNVQKISFVLPRNAKITHNQETILGGVSLWQESLFNFLL